MAKFSKKVQPVDIQSAAPYGIGNIAKFTVKNAVRLVLVLFAISLVCFILMKFSPIDPIVAYMGGEHSSLPPEQIERLREYCGVNEGFGKR